MNQRHSQNISHVSVDVDLMVGNVTQDKKGRTVSVSIIAGFYQQNIAHAKRIMPGILVHVVESVTKIVRLANT